MKNRYLFAILALLLSTLSCTKTLPKSQNTWDLQTSHNKFLIASDLHYICPELSNNSKYFKRLLTIGDGKISDHSKELLSLLIQKTIEQNPTALILTGDLTLNGALQSHQDLAQNLNIVQQHGIPVLVLPGNHDLYCNQAANFNQTGFTHIESTTSSQFKNIYNNFGFSKAKSKDSNSLSYSYQIGNTTIFMLDANTPENPCGFSEQTYKWLKNELKKEYKNHNQIIICCHQNLLRHSFFNKDYVLNKNYKLIRLLKRYKVNIFLSGHLHIQHSAKKLGITEITTSSLSLANLNYGILQEYSQYYEYNTCSLDKSLSDYANTFMDQVSAKSCRLAFIDYEEDIRNQLIEFGCILNRMYFCGTMDKIKDIDNYDEKLKLIKNSKSMFGNYLYRLKKEIGKNYNFVRITKN